MKIHGFTWLCISFLAAFAVHAGATPPANKGMGMQVMPEVIPATGREVAKDSDIKAMQTRSKAGELAPAGFERQVWNIENTSQFIHFGEETTLVPKNSILYVPERLKANVVPQPLGSMISWTEFTAKNRGLVTFLDVDLEQACGTKPLDEAKFKAACQSGMIVVALYQRSPISVAAHTASPAANP